MADSVRDHYDGLDHAKRRTLTSFGRVQRLKNANSFVKAVMYREFASAPKTVLDLACGHGNDMHKFARLGVQEYYGCDISRAAIEEATARARSIRPMKARLYCKDVMGDFTVRQGLRFDLVAMQFAVHYAVGDPARTAALLAAVRAQMEPGARFVVSTVDGTLVQLRTRGLAQEWSNGVCRLVPVGDGGEYEFHLEDTIDACVEHVVDRDDLVQQAEAAGLRLVCTHSYPEYYAEAREAHPMLHERMHVTELTQDEREVFELYRVYVFE